MFSPVITKKATTKKTLKFSLLSLIEFWYVDVQAQIQYIVHVPESYSFQPQNPSFASAAASLSTELLSPMAFLSSTATTRKTPPVQAMQGILLIS